MSGGDLFLRSPRHRTDGFGERWTGGLGRTSARLRSLGIHLYSRAIKASSAAGWPIDPSTALHRRPLRATQWRCNVRSRPTAVRPLGQRLPSAGWGVLRQRRAAPRHTFFYPIEMYDPEELDGLGELCRLGFGEVEIHLHHDGDTPENLERTLLEFRDLLADRHGLLARHRQTGALAYGFVHGNWALDNSHPDRSWCGVNNELDILRNTGCYADFTLPSTPDPTQTRKINSIYYAVDDPHKAKSHDWGTDVGCHPAPRDGLMMIQGPLVLNWRQLKWGIFPRIENGCLQNNQPPTMDRLDDWLRARDPSADVPDWYFVKLHTHGAPEANQARTLGPAHG